MQDGVQALHLPFGTTRKDTAMNGQAGNTNTATEAIHNATLGEKPERKMRGARRASKLIATNVTDEKFAIIAGHAKRAGYESLAEYVRAVTLTPKAVYDTDQARIAKPLADVSYRIARALDVLDRKRLDAVHGYLIDMQTLVADALRGLARDHDSEVRSR